MVKKKAQARKGVIYGTDAHLHGSAFTMCREADGKILSQLTYGPDGTKEFYLSPEMTSDDEDAIVDFILSLYRGR